MSDAVFIFFGSRWKGTPTFHLMQDWHSGGHRVERIGSDDGTVRVKHRTLTVCGRPIDEWGWTESPVADAHQATSGDWHRDFGIVLRRDHAELFCRPCSRCSA